MSTTTTTAQSKTIVLPTAKKKKEYNDLFEGSATIQSVEATNLRFTDGLSEEEAANSFIIAIRVIPDDNRIAIHTLELEFSGRECRFPKEYVGKKQKDYTRDELFRRGLISGADASSANIADVFNDDVIGKKISIRITEVTDPNKLENNSYHQVYLSNRAVSLSAAERARRIAALTGKPVAAPAPAPKTNPFA